MGIMDLFKPQSPTNPTGAPAPAGSNPPPAAKTDLSANPPAVGPDGKMPGTDPNNQNPLDVYSKMFDTANNGSDLQAPSFKIDPKVLSDVSSKMDFTRGVNQETLAKATSGDTAALLDIIKTVGQNSYRAALEHNTALTDSYLTNRGDFDKKSLERGVKSQLTASELSSAPNYNHPVVKAELNRIASQFAAANPDASPQEVAKAAQKYIADLQNALNPTAKTESSEEEMDWSKYLGS